MKTIDFKNEDSDTVLNDIISVRYSQGLIRELIEKHKAAPSPNMSIIALLMDHYGTLTQMASKLERKMWLITDVKFGAS